MLAEKDRISNFESESMDTASNMLFHDDPHHRNIWLIKRAIVHLFFEEFRLNKEFPDHSKAEISSYMGSDFGHYAYSLGGWSVLRDCISAGSAHSLRDMTFAQARCGFVTGEILMNAIHNGGDISSACRHVSKTIVMEDKIIITNTHYKVKNTRKYEEPEYLRKNLWYKKRCVAHLWAAATIHFNGPVDFADRMYFDVCPFNTSENHHDHLDGYAEFAAIAKSILETSISYSSSKSGREKPLMDLDKTLFPFGLKKSLVTF